MLAFENKQDMWLLKGVLSTVLTRCVRGPELASDSAALL